jgi:8-oxo-dGTP pyrophosphatase MutT (NUDIX family)
MTNTRARELRALLESYSAATPSEASHLSRMRELCELPCDPFARASFAPGHFTASAFIVSPDARELLLIHHKKLDRWLQPGGHVDPDDRDLLGAALREVREEVGMVDLALVRPAPFDLDVHEIPSRKGEPAHAHFDVRFCFRAQGREFRAGSDAQAARWVPLAEVSAEISDESVMRAVEKLRACVG